MSQVDERQWLTLTDASALTGKSIHSLRMMIRRNKLTHVKKVRGKRGEEWVVHRDAIHDAGLPEQDVTTVTHVNDEPENSPASKGEHVITLPVEYYERQQKERDELVQGLMMYRYKFEELDRQVRLLPAPVETIPVKLAEKDQALQRSQETIKALEEALQREKQRSWWDRLWKK